MKNIKPNTFQLNELFQSFNYKLPSDPELILYDFYFLTGIADQTNIPDDTVAFIVDETIKETTDALQIHMIKALKFSLTVEMRHIFGMFDWNGIGSKKLAEEYPDFIREFYRELRKNDSGSPNSDISIDWDAEIPEIMDRIEGSMIYDGNSGQRMNTFKAILRVQKTLRLDNVDLARIYQDFYQTKGWSSSYGGPKWAQIARAWEKLITAKKKTEKVIWIDHAYDLQHNTSTVFNKIKSYVKGGSYAWIGKALDWKRDLTDARAFYNRVSMTLRPLVAYISKLFSGETMQDFGMSGAIAKGAAQADDLDAFKNTQTKPGPVVPPVTTSASPEKYGFTMVNKPVGSKKQIVDPKLLKALNSKNNRNISVLVTDYFFNSNDSKTTIAGLYNLVQYTGIKFDPSESIIFGFASSKGPIQKVSIKKGKIVGGNEKLIKATFELIGDVKLSIGSTSTPDPNIDIPTSSSSALGTSEFVSYINTKGKGDWHNVWVTPTLRQHLKDGDKNVKWLLNAVIKNCQIRYNRNLDSVTVMGLVSSSEKGVFGGWWKNGVLQNARFFGNWKKGEFINSIFEGGEWFQGHFDKTSIFLKGKWHKQKYAYQGGYRGVKFAAPPNADIV